MTIFQGRFVRTAGVLVGFALLFSITATAVQVDNAPAMQLGGQQWFLDGIMSATDATAVGSFDYDADTNTYSNVNLTISNSIETGTTTYTDFFATASAPNLLAVVEESGVDLSGQRVALLSFVGNLTNEGGTVLLTGIVSSFCLDPLCFANEGIINEQLLGQVTTIPSSPSITSDSVVSVPENQLDVIDIHAVDSVDSEGSGLTFVESGGVDGALFDVDEDTGMVRFKAAPDFEAPGDSGQDNDYEIQVVVTDSSGLSEFQDLVITVTDVVEQQWFLDGVRSATGATATGTFDYDAVSNSYSNLQITIADSTVSGTTIVTSLYPFVASGPNLLFGAQEPEDGETAQRVVVFSFAADVPADGGSVAIAAVASVLCEGLVCGDSVSEDMLGQITTSPEPPVFVTDPTAVSVPENQRSAIDAAADDSADSEGSGLTFEESGGVDGSMFDVDEDTGIVQFKAAPDFENPTDANQDNVYELQVTVSDSTGLTAVQDLTVTVTDVDENVAPAITSAAAVSVAENQTSVIDVQASDDSDAEGSGLAFGLSTSGPDSALFSIDPGSGVVTFDDAPNFEAPTDVGADNVYDLSVEVTDSAGLFVVQSLSVTVTDVVEVVPNGAFVAHGRPSWDADADGFSIAENGAGHGVMVAVKADGNLYGRRVSPSGRFGAWVKLGAGGWASADIAIDENGRAEIVAVKADGRLFTRSWLLFGTFGPWAKHGAPTWDADAQPSIGTSGDRIMVAAVKADGRMFTRERGTSSGWGSFRSHGASGWAQVDLDIAADGDVWFAATKTDGRLFLRKRVGTTWSGFAGQGRATWSPTVPPSVSARSNGVVFAALKNDGKLYTRQQSSGSWAGFVAHGRGSWSSVAVDMTESGKVAFAAVKNSGALYTHIYDSSWGPWTLHGRSTWSTTASPAVTIGSGTAQLLAVKASGALYTRTFN